METKQASYTSWKTIQKKYPDKYVLLENPVFDPSPRLKEAILLYKHKSQTKVIKKKLELKPYYSIIFYTGNFRHDEEENEFPYVIRSIKC